MKTFRSLEVLLAVIFGLVAGLPQISLAQPCLLDLSAPNNTATVVISAPWYLQWPDVSAQHNPSYISNYVAVGNAVIPSGPYLGWCIDETDVLSPQPTTYSVLLFSSCDLDLNTKLHLLDTDNDFPSTVYVGPDVWNKINYILNHKNGAYFYNIQLAIWNLIGGPPVAGDFVGTAGGLPPADINEMNHLLADANANASNWQPGCGNVIAALVATADDSLDVQLTMIEVPYPCCNCTLTFNSPASVTYCSDETISNVVASENCGAGPVPVTVTMIGAVTNGIGSCPEIITTTNTAKDNCGTVHTFVQTITVNCTPDCTVTPSVKTTIVGTSNLTASVADAGPSATYVWSVMNGTITAGQGTATITWTAGTDTSSPVAITVTVTTAAGCSSTCSAPVRLTSQPPPTSLGTGDSATIGFWHNKNGQGLILGAPTTPSLANWLASNFPCMYGNLAGKANSNVATLFLNDFGVKGQKTYAQILGGALDCYFTSSNLGGGSASSKFGFNITPGGTGAKVFNVGSLGTTIGLQNNTSYTVLRILQAANANINCSNGTFSAAVFNALNTIFDGINSTGDINS